MAVSNANWIFFGNFPAIDTWEVDIVNDNDWVVLVKQLYTDMQIVNISADDANDDGQIRSDDAGGTAESFTYDLGAGTVVSTLDAEATYYASVTFADTSFHELEISLFQMENGDVFLTANDVELDNADIASIELFIEISENYTGALAPIANNGSIDNSRMICFCAGTRIETSTGPVEIEKLKPGDLVLTKDHGYQPIRWVGHRALSSADLARNSKLRPIRIAAGALGPGHPAHELRVSPQHRILVSSNIALRMFETREILAAAVQLVGAGGIEFVRRLDPVNYYHLLFDRHEIIFAENAPVESLYLGPQAQICLESDSWDEITLLYPDLAVDRAAARPAREIPKGRLIRKLVERHTKNRRPLMSADIAAAPAHSSA